MRRLASRPAYLQANKSPFAFVRGKSKKKVPNLLRRLKPPSMEHIQ